MITPPPDQVVEWIAKVLRDHPQGKPGFVAGEVALLAYAAGADFELNACRDWVSWNVSGSSARLLRESRRPNPPLTLKAQALAILNQDVWSVEDEDIIRRAVESIND